MGADLAAMRHNSQPKRKPDRARGDDLSPYQERALAKLRAEAKLRGATLATGGKGGLPPDLVLGILRRDGYRCKRCGGSEMLGVHHKAHLEHPSPAMKAKGERKSRNAEEMIVTLCSRGPDGEPGCHDDVHDEDRAKG
jgi:hypothetical protein